VTDGGPSGRRPGFVSLVGAGPGDPGLLTVAGKRAIERADVVLYDRLASPALLATVPVAGQERIHVGKLGGPGHAAQEAINALIVKRAAAGQRVARLKGGDPFVLGRGGEEAQACVDAGIAFEVIPGVSSSVAAPAYAGIPVTHRDIASGFSVLTGHERADGAYERVDWSAVAGRDGTIVVLMGVKHIARWVAGLLAGGCAPQTPVALVRWATTPRQQTLVSTLGEVVDAVAESGLKAPAVAVVGGVVALRQQLTWLEQRPLFGLTVAFTRPRKPGDAALVARLVDAGAHVLHLPLTRQVAVEPSEAFLDDPTDVAFTSANAVRFFGDFLFQRGRDARWLAGRRLWAVGPATARAMKRTLGVAADVVPKKHSAAGLVAWARSEGVGGERRVLFPCAEGARPTLPEGLVALGATVTPLVLYRTEPESNLPTRLLDALESGVNVVTLASPSAVDALVDALEAVHATDQAPPVAAIGPTTAARAQERGLNVVVVPPRATMASLVDALVEHAAQIVVGDEPVPDTGTR